MGITESALSAPSVAIHFACEASGGSLRGGTPPHASGTRPLGLQLSPFFDAVLGIVFGVVFNRFLGAFGLDFGSLRSPEWVPNGFKIRSTKYIDFSMHLLMDSGSFVG